MAKLDCEKLNQCGLSNCPYFEMHCKVYHGNECKQLGGNKIPRMRLIDRSKQEDKHQLKRVLLVTKFKPYFIIPNTRDGDQFGSAI